MRIALLDDEINALKLLEDSLREIVPDVEIYAYSSALAFLEALDNLWADVYFLDIEMPVFSGITIAQKIIEKNECANIIFVTGHNSYKADAMDLYASAYLLKPVSTPTVRKALQHLRYDVLKKLSQKPYVRTFGMFSLYVGGRAVTFHRRKSKELLAYLIHRRGAIVSRQQLTYILYEDEAHSRNGQKKLYAVYKTLCRDLEAVGAAYILQKQPEGLSIDIRAISCDLYEFLNGHTALYHGFYMEDYEWGEGFKGELMR